MRPKRSHKEPPKFIEPQLALLVKAPPEDELWAHELKLDGYRIHARISGDGVRLLTRTGLDWTARYRTTADALRELPTQSAYIDGELCALRPDGTPSFAQLQAAMDNKTTDLLIYFAFDLLFLDGKDLMREPLRARKRLLQALLQDQSLDLADPPPSVSMLSWGPLGISYSLGFYVADYADAPGATDKVLRAVWHTAKKRGLSFAPSLPSDNTFAGEHRTCPATANLAPADGRQSASVPN
jgi:hypothetical protein